MGGSQIGAGPSRGPDRNRTLEHGDGLSVPALNHVDPAEVLVSHEAIGRNRHHPLKHSSGLGVAPVVEIESPERVVACGVVRAKADGLKVSLLGFLSVS